MINMTSVLFHTPIHMFKHVRIQGSSQGSSFVTCTIHSYGTSDSSHVPHYIETLESHSIFLHIRMRTRNMPHMH
jgi:hypothetical protein